MADAVFRIVLQDDSAQQQQPASPTGQPSSAPTGGGQQAQPSTSPAQPISGAGASPGGPAGQQPPSQPVASPSAAPSTSPATPATTPTAPSLPGQSRGTTRGSAKQATPTILDTLGIPREALELVGNIPGFQQVGDLLENIGKVKLPAQPSQPVSPTPNPGGSTGAGVTTAPPAGATGGAAGAAGGGAAGGSAGASGAAGAAAGAAASAGGPTGAGTTAGAAAGAGAGAAAGGAGMGIASLAGPAAIAAAVVHFGRQGGGEVGGNLAEAVGAPRGIGESAGRIAGTVSPIIGISPTIKLASEGLKILGETARAVSKEFENQISLLQGFSTGIGTEKARSEVMQEINLMQRGGRIGPQLAGFERTKSEFEGAMFDVWTEILALGLDLFEFVKPFLSDGIDFIKDIAAIMKWHRDNVGPVFEFILGPLKLAIEFFNKTNGEVRKAILGMFGIMREPKEEAFDDPWIGELFAGMEGGVAFGHDFSFRRSPTIADEMKSAWAALRGGMP